MMRTKLLWLGSLLILATACGGGGNGASDPGRVLVFSRTTGFRHPSIEPAVAAIRGLGRDNGFMVDHTEDAGVFAAGTLASYRAIVFLSTTGNPLDDAAQRVALEDFIHGGGGFVGIHAASDQNAASQESWPWFGRLVGAYFGGHPLYRARPTGDESCQLGSITSCHDGVVAIEDSRHPATAHLKRSSTGTPPTWLVYDEFYGFRTNPRGAVHVLATLEESSYLTDPNVIASAGAMGEDHPIAWCQRFEGGRSFYTALGHDTLLYSNQEFLGHLLGGIRWASGAASGDCE